MRALDATLIVAIMTTATPLLADTVAPAARAGTATASPTFATLEPRHAKIFAPMRPEARSKVEAAARALIFDVAGSQLRGGPVDAAAKPFDLKTATRARVLEAGSFGLVSPSEADLEALVFIVLMQAAKDADADLRAVAAAVRAINKAKAAQRDGIEAVKRAVATERLRKSDADEILAHATESLDSLSSLGDVDSLRMQMAMDRMSKFMQMLSNIMKKSDDTASGIVKNLK